MKTLKTALNLNEAHLVFLMAALVNWRSHYTQLDNFLLGQATQGLAHLSKNHFFLSQKCNGQYVRGSSCTMNLSNMGR